MKLLLALIFSLVSFQPAFAGWDRTEWGMSRDEAQQAYPEASLETVEYVVSADSPAQTRQVLALTNWQFAGLRWPRVEFVFEGPGLSQVKLDTAERFESLRDRLAGQFGIPVIDESQCGRRRICERKAVFVDERNQNQITVGSVRFLGDTTWLLYEPIASGF